MNHVYKGVVVPWKGEQDKVHMIERPVGSASIQETIKTAYPVAASSSPSSSLACRPERTLAGRRRSLNFLLHEWVHRADGWVGFVSTTKMSQVGLGTAPVLGQTGLCSSTTGEGQKELL